MDVLDCLLLILIGMGAGFIQRVSGFGLGIFAMIFLPHFLPTHTAAAAITSLFSCCTSTYNAIRYRKNVKYQTVLPMIGASLIMIPIAVRFSALVSGPVFKILLGSVLILLSLYFLAFHKRIHMKANIPNGILAGTVGGILGGLFATEGPPAVLYLSSASLDNITYFATIQLYFCFTNLYATAMRAINGIINVEILTYAAVGIAGCMVGDALGRIVFEKLDSAKLKRIIYIGMIISGIAMLLN